MSFNSPASRVMSAIIALLGAAMLVATIAGGGGPAATGVVLGALFLALGLGRLWLGRRL